MKNHPTSANQHIIISKLTHDECQPLERLYHKNKEVSGFKQLDEMYLSQEFLSAAVNNCPHDDGDTYDVLIAKNEHKGEILGFSIYCKSQVKNENDNNKENRSHLIPSTPIYAGCIAAFGVDSNHHKKGIGPNLLAETIRQLEDTKKIWLFPSTTEAQQFYEKYAFVAAYDLEDPDDPSLFLDKEKYSVLVASVKKNNMHYQTQVKCFISSKNQVKSKPKLPTSPPPPIPKNNKYNNNKDHIHRFFKENKSKQKPLNKTREQPNSTNNNDCLVM